MQENVIAAASWEKQKFYFSGEYDGIPQSIKEDIQIICVTLAEKLCCTFIIKFDEEGNVYFETVKAEDDFNFDDIGAELEIKAIQRKEKELLNALRLWYLIYKTDKGESIKAELLQSE